MIDNTFNGVPDKADRLAKEIIRFAQNSLTVNMRFMDVALNRLELHQTDITRLSTDGQYLFYNPWEVLKTYKKNSASMTRNYLHVIMHCIFRHMYGIGLLNNSLWNLACDIAVENCITEFGLKATADWKEPVQQREIAKLKAELSQLTADKIYDYYLNRNLTQQQIAEIQGAFLADNHEVWYMTQEEKKETFGLDGGGSDGEASVSGTEAILVAGEAFLMTEEEWKDISEHIQMDLVTFSRNQGSQAGGMMQNLRDVNREKYDYTAFLKKFAVTGEVMKVNDDEFDYVFYTYGLKLYKKVPLIEPLEYKDVKRIREFVIAIDTSGSVMGDQVQSFVQKTYNVLMETESFFSRVNIHIIQCDAAVQEDVTITSREEFENYLKNMNIKGLGGTDFRPVFTRVNEMVEKKEFSNLKGLIYFTDGYGTFPEKKPPYETAFVFVDDDNCAPDVPPWAIKLALKKSEL